MQRMIDIQVANDFSLPKDLTEEEWHFLEDKKSFGQIKKGLQKIAKERHYLELKTKKKRKK